MNQPRSIYKTDYVPFDWVENNFTSETGSDFCSSENIDDCVRFISQELSALGYPSIYTSSNVCEYAVNCDIVKLLNVTFELIGSCRDHAQVKEDLESRNNRLFSDLNSLSKKNSQLKESLEQAENKYKCALEKERQLKEKNNRLLQTIKNEKEESKKLSSQLQQQKVTYQHEIRKQENNINQLKTKLNQILADKNPDKKIANISPSSLLQRNSKQRGKWKTGTVAKSCLEDMYNSVISSYEDRSEAMLKEISEYRHCLEFIQGQILEIDSLLGGNSEELLNIIPLSAIWNGNTQQKALEERFQFLLHRLNETASKKVNSLIKKYSDEIAVLKSKLPHHEKPLDSSKSFKKEVLEGENGKDANLEKGPASETLKLGAQKEQLEAEREKLDKEKLELSATVTFIEREKADLITQKLDIVKMAIQQESPQSQWHQNLKTLPSFSVITNKDGVTAVPSAKDLHHCLSVPDQQFEFLTPLWKSDCLKTAREKKSRSETSVGTSKRDSPATTPVTDHPKDISSENRDLPKWAVNAMTSSIVSPQGQMSVYQTIVANSASNEELEISTRSSISEQSLDLLKAAMEDIESRRNNSTK